MSKKKQIIFSSLLGIVLLVVIFMPKKETTEPLDEIEVTDSLEVKEITYKYGIPIDDYDVDYGIVKRNQSLSTILQKHGLSVGEVHRLVEKSKDVFDVRKIRSDQAYAVFTTRDSIPETCYFVYEIDPKSYVVFDLRGDYRVTMGENPVEWRRNELHGVVESSLWLAMSKYNADPQLAVVLSNIFGWTIDFFGLQKQDEFRVIMTWICRWEEFAYFNVLGAAFRHGDSTYYAIPFELNGRKIILRQSRKEFGGGLFESSFGFFQDFFPFLEQPFPPCVEALPGSSRCRLCCADGYSGVCHRERPGYCKRLSGQGRWKLRQNQTQ